MTTLNVGQNKQFSTIAAAVAASRDGDVVAVDAGTYVNDFATINTKITIAAVGGTAHLVATVAPPNGKAILVTNTDVTLDRLEFSGAAVPDGNGAGIRYQGGSLTITNSYFHDNQMGVLAADAPSGSVTIRGSEFAFNGTGDGFTHNFYAGEVGTLTIEGSYFHDAVLGHQIKSRADTTIIRDSRVIDGAGGTGSYSIDLPNGGRAVLSNNFIEQGAASGNPVIVAFGEEGNLRANSSLQMTGNIVVNDLASPSVKLLWNATGATAELAGNQVFGLTPGQYGSGPIDLSGMVALAARPVAGVVASLAALPATAAPEAMNAGPPAALPAAVTAALLTPVNDGADAAAELVPTVVAEILAAAPAAPAFSADAGVPAATSEVGDWEEAIATLISTPATQTESPDVAAPSPEADVPAATSDAGDWEEAIATALSTPAEQFEAPYQELVADAEAAEDWNAISEAALQEIAAFATSDGAFSQWDAVLQLLANQAGQGDSPFG